MSLIWKPTLAATLPVDADLTKLPYPLWASPKYDGMRALVQGGKLVSRNGLAVPNRSACAPIEAMGLEGLDGELVVGNPTAPDVRNRTMSYLSTKSWAAAPEPLTYFVFDWCMAAPQTLPQRTKRLINTLGKGRQNVDAHTKVVLVKQTSIVNIHALVAYEAKMVALGHEGVMLRRNDGTDYMQKRSTMREFELVKWKRWETGQAAILAVHPLEHNANTETTAAGRKSSKKAGMVVDAKRYGSATLIDCKTGVEFSVQIPGDKLQAWPGWRAGAWHGTKVVYKYQPGAKGVPIHPTCAFTELGVE
jgi:DNA ligase-1